MMCTSRFSLIQSIIVASVVVLPEPVGPVTRIKPRGRSSRFKTASGSPIAFRFSSWFGIRRSAAP
jgi:hypothetical protein